MFFLSPLLTMADLADFISFSSVEALNENPEHSFQNALKKVRNESDSTVDFEAIDRSMALSTAEPAIAQTFFFPSTFPSLECLSPTPHQNNKPTKQGYREDAGLFLESDTDEQLLINIPFTQGKGENEKNREMERKRGTRPPEMASLWRSPLPRFAHPPRGKKTLSPAVKLTSISIRAPEADKAPRRVRVFVNRPSIGFPEAESDPAAAEFELSAYSVANGTPQALKVAKFTSVNSIAIFFADNLGGGEVTRVSAIALEGSAGETFNVAEIKKVGEEGAGA